MTAYKPKTAIYLEIDFRSWRFCLENASLILLSHNFSLRAKLIGSVPPQIPPIATFIYLLPPIGGVRFLTAAL